MISGAVGAAVVAFLATICAGFETNHHHNYNEMIGVMEKTAEKCPEITYFYTLPAESPDSRNTTWDGKHLAVIVFSDNPQRHEAGMFITV